MRNLIVVACCVGLVIVGYLTLAPKAADPDTPIRIEEGFARASGKSAKAGAAFMTIHNQSGTADRLIAARTDAAAMVELHTHIEDDNGIMMMREIEGGIAIADGGMAVLKRGGDHVMLMGLTGPLSDGDTVELILTFEKAGDVAVSVPVNNQN